MCRQFIESSNNSHKTILDRIASIKGKINMMRGFNVKPPDVKSHYSSARSIHSAVLPSGAGPFRTIHSEERINSPIDINDAQRNTSFDIGPSSQNFPRTHSGLSALSGQSQSALKMRPHSRAIKSIIESPGISPEKFVMPMVNVEKYDPAEMQQHLTDLKKLHLINK
jgi:hypothetical protein